MYNDWTNLLAFKRAIWSNSKMYGKGSNHCSLNIALLIMEKEANQSSFNIAYHSQWTNHCYVVIILHYTFGEKCLEVTYQWKFVVYAEEKTC